MRILIVEDEIKIRRGMANLLEKNTEHTVVGEAKNGQEGLEMALQYQPDLVITDIRMPKMNGLEMIQALREQGGSWRFVILSGYSEFEYAKQAIRFGVDDYLIKPLAPEDVIDLLQTIEEKIAKEVRKSLGKPEKMLKDYLLEHHREASYLENLALVCDVEQEDSFCLISAYMGTAVQEQRNYCMERFAKLKEQFPKQKFFCFFIESTREFICLTQDRNREQIQEELEQRLLKRKLHKLEWVWTRSSFKGLEHLKSQYERQRGFYLYGLVGEYDEFISQEWVDNFEPIESQYPKNLENKLQKTFYGENKELFTEAARNFEVEMGSFKTRPVQIKESYMKMVNFLINLGQENNRVIYEQLQNLNVVRNIGAAVTKKELNGIFEEVLTVFINNMGRRQDISNYTIKRTIDYIRDHYSESISLEGVADSLDITPEYLSTLFNREMDENFSVFLKKFRISHAKRLLKGTDKKIYEVAQEVGYSDPKYFNRVFKEEEGISPGDYRSLQK